MGQKGILDIISKFIELHDVHPIKIVESRINALIPNNAGWSRKKDGQYDRYTWSVRCSPTLKQIVTLHISKEILDDVRQSDRIDELLDKIDRKINEARKFKR